MGARSAESCSRTAILPSPPPLACMAGLNVWGLTATSLVRASAGATTHCAKPWLSITKSYPEAPRRTPSSQALSCVAPDFTFSDSLCTPRAQKCMALQLFHRCSEQLLLLTQAVCSQSTAPLANLRLPSSSTEPKQHALHSHARSTAWWQPLHSAGPRTHMLLSQAKSLLGSHSMCSQTAW